MLLDPDNSRLVLVDYQARLMPAIDDHVSVLKQAVRLGKLANLLDVETVGTEQNPLGLGSNQPEIRSLCSQIFAKMNFAAFSESAPLEWLLGSSKKQLVLAGCESHVCLLQTAFSALAHGASLAIVEDACGSRKASDRRAAMARLRIAGAQIVTFEMVAFEWLRSSEHPKFKRVLALLK